MLKRVRKWLVGLFALLLACASISWTAPATITLVDDHGRPASGAYVRFHYESDLLNFVHPVTYLVRGSVIVKADSEGRITVPFRIHFRRPVPLMTLPSLRIDDIVVPRLHNTFGPIAAGVTSPGAFDVDASGERITAFDVSGDPELWERSLQQLHECIWQTLAGGLAPAAADDALTKSHARELIDHLRRDFRALLDAHGQRPRTPAPPPDFAPESERQQWRERAAADVAREPLLGPYIERMWRGRIKQLDSLEAKAASAHRSGLGPD